MRNAAASRGKVHRDQNKRTSKRRRLTSKMGLQKEMLQTVVERLDVAVMLPIYGHRKLVTAQLGMREDHASAEI